MHIACMPQRHTTVYNRSRRLQLLSRLDSAAAVNQCMEALAAGDLQLPAGSAHSISDALLPLYIPASSPCRTLGCVCRWVGSTCKSLSSGWPTSSLPSSSVPRCTAPSHRPSLGSKTAIHAFPVANVMQ